MSACSICGCGGFDLLSDLESHVSLAHPTVYQARAFDVTKLKEGMKYLVDEAVERAVGRWREEFAKRHRQFDEGDLRRALRKFLHDVEHGWAIVYAGPLPTGHEEMVEEIKNNPPWQDV